MLQKRLQTTSSDAIDYIWLSFSMTKFDISAPGSRCWDAGEFENQVQKF